MTRSQEETRHKRLLADADAAETGYLVCATWAATSRRSDGADNMAQCYGVREADLYQALAEEIKEKENNAIRPVEGPK